MKKTVLLLLLALGWANHARAAAMLSAEVGYGFGGTSSSGIYTGSPDTSFVVITNTGTESFTGDLTLTGTAGIGPVGDVADVLISVTLAPGDSKILLGGPEGSNQLGFNKCQPGTDPLLGADNGLLLSVIGAFATAGPISYTIYDHEIHSGTSATNPFGVTLDNYILQGGDPFGRDTFDPFEVAQAHAFFDISHDRAAMPLDCAVPEPASLVVWSGLGALGLAVSRFRRRTA